MFYPVNQPLPVLVKVAVAILASQSAATSASKQAAAMRTASDARYAQIKAEQAAYSAICPEE